MMYGSEGESPWVAVRISYSDGKWARNLLQMNLEILITYGSKSNGQLLQTHNNIRYVSKPFCKFENHAEAEQDEICGAV